MGLKPNSFRINDHVVPSRKKAQVLNFFLAEQEISAVRTPQFGVSEARIESRGVTMLLIDQKGSRVRPVCRQHAYLGKGCPKCRAERERSSRSALEFMSAVYEAKRLVAGAPGEIRLLSI